MIAPDHTTFNYIKGKDKAPKGADWDNALAYWKTLKTDDGAVFDKEYNFNAEDIEPMITYGTNPVSYTHLDVYKRQVHDYP